MQEELDYLWKVKRPQVTRSVSEAAAQGDRSENAEYIYGKKQLREIDRRVRFLRKRLDEVSVVAATPEETDRVYFGAWVMLLDEEGNKREYRIVGADEFDHANSYISVDAPLAKALLKKKLDDEISVSSPSGSTIYCIINIRYD